MPDVDEQLSEVEKSVTPWGLWVLMGLVVLALMVTRWWVS